MKKIVPEKSWLIPEHAKRVFKGVIFDIYQWPQKLFDGSDAVFEMARRPDIVDTIAVKDGKFAIIHEEQPGNEPFYDIPGGRHDHDDEPHLEAAKRELLEETGMEFANGKLIEVKQYGPKVESFSYVYLATEFLAQKKQNLDAGEKIKVEMVTLEEYSQLYRDKQLRSRPDLFENIQSLNDLLALSEFKGKEVDR